MSFENTCHTNIPNDTHDFTILHREDRNGFGSHTSVVCYIALRHLTLAFLHRVFVGFAYLSRDMTIYHSTMFYVSQTCLDLFDLEWKNSYKFESMENSASVIFALYIVFCSPLTRKPPGIFSCWIRFADKHHDHNECY